MDPEFHNDRGAVAHLEQAMQMIRQISANHFCAQRAFTFLQQLLGLLDKTLPDNRQRSLARTERSTSVEPTGTEGGPSGPLPVDEMMPDLWAFWGSTQDLTTDLGSQLEMHSTLGNGMWSWVVQNQGEGHVEMAVPPAL